MSDILIDSISLAIRSTDAVDVMQGYVNALGFRKTPDRETILAFLLKKIYVAQGDLLMAEKIACTAYRLFRITGVADEAQAIAEAHLGLTKAAQSTGNHSLAEQIANTACGTYALGTPEHRAATKALDEIRDCQLKSAGMAEHLGATAPKKMTIALLAKQVREIQAHAARAAHEVGNP